jgi:hypothetical protein
MKCCEYGALFHLLAVYKSEVFCIFKCQNFALHRPMSETFLPQKFVEISGSKKTENKKSKMKMTRSGRIGTWVKAR